MFVVKFLWKTRGGKNWKANCLFQRYHSITKGEIKSGFFFFCPALLTPPSRCWLLWLYPVFPVLDTEGEGAVTALFYVSIKIRRARANCALKVGSRKCWSVSLNFVVAWPATQAKNRGWGSQKKKKVDVPCKGLGLLLLLCNLGLAHPIIKFLLYLPFWWQGDPVPVIWREVQTLKILFMPVVVPCGQ